MKNCYALSKISQRGHMVFCDAMIGLKTKWFFFLIAENLTVSQNFDIFHPILDEKSLRGATGHQGTMAP